MSENFEQQVKSMLDDVQLTPKPAVWQHVQQAIQPEKRKRRFIFWWILPVAITAGILIYVMSDRGEEKSSIAKVDVAKAPGNATVTAQGNTVPSATDNKTTVNTPPVDRDNQQKDDNADLSYRIENKSYKVNGRKTSRKVPVTNDPAISQVNQPVVTNNVQAADRSTATNNKQGNNVTTNSNVTTDNATKESAVTKKNEVIVKTENKEPLSNKTEQVTGENKDVTQLPESKKGWRFGMAAEWGVTNAVAGVAVIGNSKNDALVYTSPADVGSGPGSGVGSGAGNKPTYSRVTTTAKSSFGIYFTAQRQLNRSVAFQSLIGFKQQSFSVTATTYKDSLFNTWYSAFPVVRSGGTYRFNSLDVYTGLSFKLLQAGEMKLSTGAGIHNQFIIGAKYSGKYETFINSFNTADKSTSSISSFNRWQPGLHWQLTADFGPSKQQWLQLSPYVTYGLRSFEKSPMTNKNHLASFGITASYFFR